MLVWLKTEQREVVQKVFPEISSHFQIYAAWLFEREDRYKCQKINDTLVLTYTGTLQELKQDVIDSLIYCVFQLPTETLRNFAKNSNIEIYRNFMRNYAALAKSENRWRDYNRSFDDCKVVCKIYDQLEDAPREQILYYIFQLEDCAGLNENLEDLFISK